MCLQDKTGPRRDIPRAPREGVSASDVERAFEHGVEHRRRQLAGERVLLTGVERAQQDMGPDVRFGAVREPGPWPGPEAAFGQDPQRAIPAERPQRDDRAEALERG